MTLTVEKELKDEVAEATLLFSLAASNWALGFSFESQQRRTKNIRKAWKTLLIVSHSGFILGRFIFITSIGL